MRFDSPDNDFSLMDNCVKFLDVAAINAQFLTDFQYALSEIVHSGRVLHGKHTTAFEDDFAKYCGAAYCVGVANGFDALWLTLLAKKLQDGWRDGDEVIVPAHTFVATAQAVIRAGLHPILVDVSLQDYLIDTRLLEKSITSRTRAILPVHLYGRMADMKSIIEIAHRYGLFVLEDAAQAHGATYNTYRAGSNYGENSCRSAAAYSFYPGKNLGALGDGGAVVSNDKSLISCVRQLANYGASVKYTHELLGTNSRLDELQAAFLRHKLNKLDDDNTYRQAIAGCYINEIQNPYVTIPYASLQPAKQLESVFHIFPIFTNYRVELQQHLEKKGIQTLIHYPIPLHRQPCLRPSWNVIHEYPNAELISNTELSLPISPVLAAEHVERVVDAINSFEL